MAQEIAKGCSDVGFEFFTVDDFAYCMIRKSQHLNVVETPRYGSFLSDAARDLLGGLGLAPSRCCERDHTCFKQAHSTKPDIAGKGVINPRRRCVPPR